MKVLIPSNHPISLDGHDTVQYDPIVPIPAEHHDADVLVTWRNTNEQLATAASSLGSLKLVQTLSAGPDQAVAAGFAASVQIASGRSLHDETVAEHTLALVLAHVRAIPRSLAAQAEHRWASDIVADQRAPETTGQFTLADAHVAVWGFGSIAAKLAPLLTALGAKVTGIARSAGERSGYPVVAETDIAQLLPEIDLLISILPATEATDAIVNADVFTALPDHAVFVNVGRGTVVDEAALIEALASGAIRGAALDVMREEPLPAESPLWDAKNIILTPHIAGDRPRGAQPLVQAAVDAVAAGNAPENVVER